MSAPTESFSYDNERPPVAPMPVKPRKVPKPPKAPKPKRPMHAVVTDALLVLLAVASLGLSGWSLATLLQEAGAPVWVACLGVGVFDLVALAAGLQVYARRSAPHTAGGARMVMMLALIASSIVNGAHGAQLGGWTTAVVLAAAPLSFEIVFELRHRTLTALIWILFRREAALALRRDAWERIAPIAAQPLVTIEREHQAVPAVPERTDAVAELERLRAELAEAARSLELAQAVANRSWAELPAAAAEALPVSPERDAAERDEEMLALYRAVQSTPGATEADRDWAAELAEIAARREPVARPADAPMLVKSAAVEPVAPGGEPVDRVPEQRPASMAAGMRELVAAGITDPEVQAARLAVALGREVSMDAVKRENRRIVQAQREAAEKAAAQDADPLTGQYL